jgi:nucleoside 2-deoxyribosyltransferase
MVVYVAGPYRNPSNWEIHRNIFVAETLAFEVWKAGMCALSPHLNTAHFQYALPDEVWLQGDLEMLRRCDALIVTMGWENSAGTRAEVAFAKSHDIPVFFTIAGLKRWAAEEVKRQQDREHD